jgi:hypothetical protein
VLATLETAANGLESGHLGRKKLSQSGKVCELMVQGV